ERKRISTSVVEDANRLPAEAAHESYATLEHHGILMERNIYFYDFAQIELTTQFEQRGWFGIGSGHGIVYPEMVREFYSNVTEIDMDTHSLNITIRGRNVFFFVIDIVD
ncbi:hypothetical protein U1Q18_043178, partial [Sarracenia purpurea var. burkii]